METYETVEYKNCTIKIYQDTDAQSPDEWQDDEIVLLGFNDRYFSVERKGFTQEEIIDAISGGKYEDGSINTDARDLIKKFWIFELSLYVHSGTTVRLGESAGPCGPGRTRYVEPLEKLDREDAERRAGDGVVLISKKEARTKKEASKRAQGIVGAWDQYLNGEVYGYKTETPGGEDIDSCWGFYGDEGIEQIKSEGKSSIDGWIIEEEKKNAKAMERINTRGRVQIYDNGGKSTDRYTIIDGSEAYGMSENPGSPQGFNQYIGEPGKLHVPALGKKISFLKLPAEVKKAIVARVRSSQELPM